MSRMSEVAARKSEAGLSWRLEANLEADVYWYGKSEVGWRSRLAANWRKLTANVLVRAEWTEVEVGGKRLMVEGSSEPQQPPIQSSSIPSYALQSSNCSNTD